MITSQTEVKAHRHICIWMRRTLTILVILMMRLMEIHLKNYRLKM